MHDSGSFAPKPACDGLKPVFHDTDSDSPDMPTSLRPTRAISWSYSCGKLNGDVARHADTLATTLARMSARTSVSRNVAFSALSFPIFFSFFV